MRYKLCLYIYLCVCIGRCVGGKFNSLFFIVNLWILSQFDHTRLRQESELLSKSSSQHWSQSDLQSYASTTNIAADNDALLVSNSNSLSSTETLKWLGSMSDISSSSHATNTSHISASGNYYHSSSYWNFCSNYTQTQQNKTKQKKTNNNNNNNVPFTWSHSPFRFAE